MIVVLSFLGKLFEAVPRLDRSIPQSRVLCLLRSFCTAQYSPRQAIKIQTLIFISP